MNHSSFQYKEDLKMVHAYHVIMPAYGFWLPNDPRGSWSDTIRKWELVRFGQTTKSGKRRSLKDLPPRAVAKLRAARAALKYPPVSLSNEQISSVAKGFADQATKCNYTIFACSILPEHAHLVVARHHYKIEQITNLLKGAATSQLILDNCHPLAKYCDPGSRPPRMWAQRRWKVFLNTEYSILRAIQYVEQNPVKLNERVGEHPSAL